MANPASGVWDATALNWDDGTAWTQGDKALFNASDEQTISVGEVIHASGISVYKGDYSFSGSAIYLASTYPVSSEQADMPVSVGDGASATFLGQLCGSSLNAIRKYGEGTLTIAGGGSALQIKASGGALQITNCTFRTAKIYPNEANSTSTLLLDKVQINTWNENRLIGHYNRFAHAYIGAGGFTVNCDYNAGIWQCFETAPGLAADGGITKTGLKELRIEPQGTDVSTFTGGIAVQSGELVVGDVRGLGTGPVSVANGAAVVLSNAAPNQVHAYRLRRGAIFGGAEGTSLVVDAPGVVPEFDSSNPEHYIGLGRYGTGQCSMTFAPTNDVALGCLFPSGKLDLRLGGTIKAAEDSNSPFFNTRWFNAGSTISVVADGVTFDIPSGEQELGAPVSVPIHADQVVASTTPSSFESGTEDWSFSQNGSADGNGTRTQNGSAFFPSTYPDRYTSDGSSFMYLRRGNYMQTTTMNVPSDGKWRVAFKAACRGEYEARTITITVTIDGHSHTFGARDEEHGFIDFATPAYDLTAGNKTCKIELSDNGKQWAGMGFDWIRLEKVADVPASFVKTGSGTLVADDFSSEGAVSVNAGKLALRDFTLDGATVQVASGAALALHGGTLRNSTVMVSSGATFAFAPECHSCVKNGSFEASSGSQGSWRFTVSDWTFSIIPGRTNNDSGGQTNGSQVSSGSNAYATRCGYTTAYIRSQMQMEQQLTVPEDGEYAVSFLHSQRVYDLDKAYLNPLSVEIDGAEVLYIPARTGYIDYTRVTSTNVALTAGSHTLRFRNLGSVGSPDGAMLFIDDVRLDSQKNTFVFDGTSRIDLAVGSTVRLDNTVPLAFEKGYIYVGDRVFQGSERTLASYGVTVVGNGRLQVGQPLGTFLMVR